VKIALILALLVLGACGPSGCAHVFDDAIFEKSTEGTRP
jgi:hypothetical protein